MLVSVLISLSSDSPLQNTLFYNYRTRIIHSVIDALIIVVVKYRDNMDKEGGLGDETPYKAWEVSDWDSQEELRK